MATTKRTIFSIPKLINTSLLEYKSACEFFFHEKKTTIKDMRRDQSKEKEIVAG